jgi:CRP-like cAMP-binding protein
MQEFLAMLDRIRPLSEPLRAAFTGVIVEKSVRKNEQLVRAGVINNHLYFIKKGLIRCYNLKEDERTKTAREVNIFFFMENDIIASTGSYAQQKPGQEWMVALEDSEVCLIHFQELEKLYAAFPELNLHGRLLTQKYSTIWYTLLGGLRTLTAKQRYQFLLDHFPRLVQRVPDKHLSSFLGINAVTLSRIKGQR